MYSMEEVDALPANYHIIYGSQGARSSVGRRDFERRYFEGWSGWRLGERQSVFQYIHTGKGYAINWRRRHWSFPTAQKILLSSRFFNIHMIARFSSRSTIFGPIFQYCNSAKSEKSLSTTATYQWLVNRSKSLMKGDDTVTYFLVLVKEHSDKKL